MDLTLYQFLIAPLKEPPDLSVVQQKLPVHEDWPLILKSIQLVRQRVSGFTVSDGKTEVLCHSKLLDVYNVIASLEPGAIVHLIGSVAVFDDASRSYQLDVQDVYTLKQYDEIMRDRQEAEAVRAAKIQEELSQYSEY